MKPNDKKNIFIKVRDAYRRFMNKEPEVKRLEELDKKPLRERLLANAPFYGYIILALILFIGILVYSNLNNDNSNLDSEINRGVLLTSEFEGIKRQIGYQEINSYMIDSSDGTNVEILKAKLDDKVSYSITYKTNEKPKGEMNATKQYSNGYITSVLINGYPNVSYEEMNLQSEDEAYLATQLAIYQMLAKKNSTIINGEFNINNIISCDEEHSDMVQRIVLKAKEIYSLAMEEPYIESADVLINDENLKMETKENTTIVGPIITSSITDEATKRVMGEEYNPVTSVDVKSYIENSNIKIIDENGNEIEKVLNDKPFYIKIDGSDKIFAQYKISMETNYLEARIYESKDYENRYVALESDYIMYIDVYPILKGLPYGTAIISLKTGSDNEAEGISYYIYDENKQLIQDIDGFASEYEFYLKTGKYYVEIYDKPDGYFIENNIHEFEVKNNEETSVNIIFDSIY